MKDLLLHPAFQETLMAIAKEEKRNISEIKKEAGTYLKELYTKQQALSQVIFVQAIDYLLSRGYDKHIDVHPEELKKLSRLMLRHPIAFVMTHKTYFDMGILAHVLHQHGLPASYIFGGINLKFSGFAQIAKQTGVIFIRRSFKDNKVYKASLRHYISSLLNDKSSFMWAIEGTRSRTGKLVWPQMGILKYIMEAEEVSREEVKYVPVSIVYDLIPDVKDMTLEAKGVDKQAENFRWMVEYLRKMGSNLGRIAIRIGDPVDLRASYRARLPEATKALGPGKQKVSRLAFELVHRINQITPVTTTSLICVILLSKFSAGKKELEQLIYLLMEYIEKNQPHALIDRGKVIGESVQTALNLLLQQGLIHLNEQGIMPEYRIAKEHYLQSTYYANMAIHHLYQRAFIELCFLHVMQEKKKNRELAFWKKMMEIRDLFKFEFFYSAKAMFSEEIERNLSILHESWRDHFFKRKTDLMKVLQKRELLLAPVVLSMYVDAYQVVGQALKKWDTSKDFEEKAFIDLCISLGEEMDWNGEIRRQETASKPFLINGIRLAKNRGLIPTAEDDKVALIDAFLEEMNALARDLTSLQDITLHKSTQHEEVPMEYNFVPGSKTEAIVSEIIEGENGPQVGAFFDLDRTLIRSYSATEFMKSRIFSGKMTPQEIVGQFAGIIIYATGNKNFSGLMSVSTQGLKGIPEQTFVEMGEEIYLERLSRSIYPEARALVTAHLEKGHTVAIISAATPYQVNPIARDLGIDHVMCTRMEVHDGRFTGKVVHPTCWGQGKAHYARVLAEDQGVDLDKSYFYTDAIDDLPLLEIVGNPRPMNPDADLAKLAFKEGWPVYRFNTNAKVGTSNIVRTVMAAGSMIPVILTGIAKTVSTLSSTEGINAMIAAFGDVTTAIAGIELAIKGEENLHIRPAVYLMNHQSSVDALIAAKLMRKDLVGVAKKEVKSYPLIGQAMAASGMIFLDRENKEKAIESLNTAVDVLHSGKAIMIMPEGTRSKDYTLGKFKKGAFHIAMAAKVPLVPIVVYNAHDVMPKGAMFMKSGVVQVEVLSPISTDDWTKETLNEHVEEIRQLFLDKLGQ